MVAAVDGACCCGAGRYAGCEGVDAMEGVVIGVDTVGVVLLGAGIDCG